MQATAYAVSEQLVLLLDRNLHGWEKAHAL